MSEWAVLSELPADDWWFPVTDTQGGTVPRHVALRIMARRDAQDRVARLRARRRGLSANGWINDVHDRLSAPNGVPAAGERPALVTAAETTAAGSPWSLGTTDVGTRWAVRVRRVDRASGRIGRAGPRGRARPFCHP